MTVHSRVPVVAPVESRSELSRRTRVAVGIHGVSNLVRILAVHAIERQLREARETRASKRPPHATAHASHADSHPPRRERAADADDRNPDQAPVSRVSNRTGAPSAPILTGTAGRPSLRRKHPIPALLMKRSVREPEKV